MIPNAKIQFSEDELSLMQNRAWILTKNRIIEKISAGFEELAANIHTEITSLYPQLAETILISGYKVSRGEKYQGLPYLILDLPRMFGKEHILAIRVLFWWGNYFSITLHTKGRYADGLRQALLAGSLLTDDLMVAVSGDEWNHDLLHSDYRELNTANLSILTERSEGQRFIKLSRNVKLMQWEQAEPLLYSQYHRFIQMINLSFQAGETGL